MNHNPTMIQMTRMLFGHDPQYLLYEAMIIYSHFMVLKVVRPWPRLIVTALCLTNSIRPFPSLKIMSVANSCFRRIRQGFATDTYRYVKINPICDRNILIYPALQSIHTKYHFLLFYAYLLQMIVIGCILANLE